MGTYNFDEMPRVMKGYEARYLAGASAIIRHAAREALVTAVRGTPVVKGLARSNWQVTLDGPSHSSRLPYAPYPPYSGPKFGETANASAAIATGIGQTAAFTVVTHKSISITNNVRYIGSINEYSRQNVHFFEDAVETAKRALTGRKVLEVDTETGLAQVQ